MSRNQDDETTYFVIDWVRFHNDSRRLAHKLSKLGRLAGIVAVTRGGLIPASIIARELNIRVIESVGMAAYDDLSRTNQVKHIKNMNMDLVGDGSGWVIVDDLVDSGITARAIKALIPKAHMATVYAKPEGQKEAHTFVEAVPQDYWLLFPWDSTLYPHQPLIDRKIDSDDDSPEVLRVKNHNK